MAKLNLARKIEEEYKKSKELREIAWSLDAEKAIEVRKLEQEVFDKYNFYKNLSKAIDKCK